ncbi:MAG TPA: tetratricopeptide repeat protein [Thermoanaerobaculia bacterium]|nr:tetratricopeptide repeat protein [Thermoanaerobaculia bacterium]
MVAGCATSPPLPPTPVAAPVGTLPLDPRLGYGDTPGESRSRSRLDAALRDLAAGREARAVQQLEALAAETPGYAPAGLTLGALALLRGDLAAAAGRIESAERAQPGWTAAAFYRAELLAAEGREREALEVLRPLAWSEAAPGVIDERIAAVETRLFDRLYREASGESGAAAAERLREALALRPESTPARLLLVQKLIEAGILAEARMEIDPILRTAERERSEVQSALAEIEAGRGEYEAAIRRYERVVERDPRPSYANRLEALKRQFALANMPPRVQAAAASPALTRGEMAILTYWNVSAVRFGRLVSEPTVAVDIAETPGRDELVRTIGFGLLQVDSATRRVDPDRVMTRAAAARFLFRLLTLRGVPACAASAAEEPGELARAIRALAACGIELDAVLIDPNAAVPASWVLPALKRIDAVVSAE